MVNVVVTGSSGFIGSAICRRLEQDGNSVFPFTRRITGLKNEVVIDNAVTEQDLSKILTGVHTIVHLAARVHVFGSAAKGSLDEYRRVNTEKTVVLAKSAALSGVKRFIFMSTIGVNGDETLGRPFTAADDPTPHSEYALSKLEAELGLKELTTSTGIEHVIIRPPLVYGPHAPGNFRMLMRMVKSGLPIPLGCATKNSRSYVGIDNLADLTATCVKQPKAANQTFLVSDDEDLSTADLLARLGKAVGSKWAPVRVPLPLIVAVGRISGKSQMLRQLLGNLQVDIHHTQRTLGWTPPFSIDEGFSRL